MKIFISGKITGEPDYRVKFNESERRLRAEGHEVMNPSVLPSIGFEHEEYLHICKAMIDVCEAIYLLPCWKESDGANQELGYALDNGKMILKGDKKMCLCQPEIRTPVCQNCLLIVRRREARKRMDELLLSLSDEEREILSDKLNNNND